MKTIYCTLFLFFSFGGFAQIGIGTTTPHESAILDVNVDALSQKKGFLMPRVALQSNTDIATIENPVNAMTVFTTQDAGSGVDQVFANRVSVFDGGMWQSISNLAEIRTLKVPTEFIVASTNQQIFAADNRLANVNAGEVEVVKWQTSEISLENLEDISFSSSEFTILNEGFYQFSGSVNVKTDIASTAFSQIVLVLQSRIGTGLWTDFYSSSVGVDKAVGTKIRTIAIPRFIKQAVANEKIRMVLYKPSSMTNLGANSGVVVNNVGDQTKSFRITTVKQ